MLKVLYIFIAFLTKILLKREFFQHVQDMEILGLSTAVCFDIDTYFNSQLT